MKTSAYLYVVTDGNVSKIGVTEQALEKRISAYKTHNPNAHLFANYQFASIEQARRIEVIVRRRFASQQVAAGKEWFSVSPAQLAAYALEQFNPASQHYVTNSALIQSSQPTPQFLALQDELAALQRVAPIASNSPTTTDAKRRDRITAIKNECKVLFGSHFHIGAPEQQIVLEKLTAYRDHPAPDMIALKGEKLLGSDLARACVMQPSKLRFPAQDHECYFWQLHPLASGVSVPFVHTAIVMPYVEHLARDELAALADESKRFARAIGWTFVDHSEWSWYAPGSTALFAYQMQTGAHRIQKEFSTSLRRFVIEQYAALDTRHCDLNEFEKVLSDLAADRTFPYWIRTYEELIDTYLGPIWGRSLDDDDDTARAYLTLFEEWQVWREAKAQSEPR